MTAAGRRADEVLRSLRAEIVAGTYPAGSRLTEPALCERYGVSRVPVREALKQLEAEGFVVSVAYAGVRVAHIDATDPAKSSVSVTIAAGSVTTGSKDRDGHLSSADFFDVETYPELTFVSTSVARDGDEWTISGDLTIKGVTKPVSIEFEQTGSAQDPFGNVRVGFEGDVTVNRKDWGLTWNAALETGGVLVSEKVTLEFDISAIAASDQK